MRPMARATTQGVAKKLRTYQKKRDFKRTPEPKGARAKKPAPGLSFVVQKHAARRLHYDFRLELGGVLLSWAVPKGPSLKPEEKRLAVRTEDHPLEYADFEGEIPRGEYGGGTVIVWDRGSWTPEGDPERGLKAGRLTFDLHGQKLNGRFHLVRTRGQGKEKSEQWLLFKGKGEGADSAIDVVDARRDSVLSGRSLEEVRESPERTWSSKRRDTMALVKRLPLPFALTNLEKVLYPKAKLRKADVIAYYASIANVMLPHVAGRPLTFLRCPNGVDEQCFYQKHVGRGLPDAVRRLSIAEKEATTQGMAIDDMNGLIALAQLGVLEIHTWGCHAATIERPDKLVLDIDPDPELDWSLVVEAAVEVRQRLSDVGIESFVQTTGGKGLHVVAPLHPKLTWDEHKHFSHALVLAMAADNPKRYVTTMTKSARKGRVFLDYLRNTRGATAITPYSTRKRDKATVAAPLTWDELMAGVGNADFTVRTMIDRISRPGYDPWAEYFELRQSISPKAMRDVRNEE